MEAATARIGRRQDKRRYGSGERRLAVLMLSPAMVVIAVVAAYPIGYAIWLSLNEYSVRTPGLSRWAGLRNYETALSAESFQSAIVNTMIFTVGSVTLELFLGIAMAMAMHNAFKGKRSEE